MDLSGMENYRKIVAPLEEANRLQKEFVLFAGHELKTPVTVMKASLDMLEREGIHSKYLDYAAEENEKNAQTGNRASGLFQNGVSGRKKVSGRA